MLSAIQNKTINPVGSMESKNIDVRIISATNADLSLKIKQNQFREDLMYRLNTITIEIPALRERKEDIPEFIHFFINKFRQKYNKAQYTIPDNIMERLKNYSWPGNIRELRHCVERAVILSQDNQLRFSDFRINEEHAQPGLNDPSLQNTFNLEVMEKNTISKAIEKAKGNYSRASEMLGISRKTLYNKISKYGL
jgi:DNA-binding NtrC family response regulator